MLEDACIVKLLLDVEENKIFDATLEATNLEAGPLDEAKPVNGYAPNVTGANVTVNVCATSAAAL